MLHGLSVLCTVQVEKPRKQTKVLKNSNKERKKQKRGGSGGRKQRGTGEEEREIKREVKES